MGKNLRKINRGLERWLSTYKHLFFQRTQVWSSESTLDGSEPTITPTLVILMPSSSFCGCIYSHVHTHVHIQKCKIAGTQEDLASCLSQVSVSVKSAFDYKSRYIYCSLDRLTGLLISFLGTLWECACTSALSNTILIIALPILSSDKHTHFALCNLVFIYTWHLWLQYPIKPTEFRFSNWAAPPATVRPGMQTWAIDELFIYADTPDISILYYEWKVLFSTWTLKIGFTWYIISIYWVCGFLHQH